MLTYNEVRPHHSLFDREGVMLPTRKNDTWIVTLLALPLLLDRLECVSKRIVRWCFGTDLTFLGITTLLVLLCGRSLARNLCLQEDVSLCVARSTAADLPDSRGSVPNCSRLGAGFGCRKASPWFVCPLSWQTVQYGLEAPPTHLHQRGNLVAVPWCP